MKINLPMRFLVQLRRIIGCAAAITIVGLAFFVGVTVATQIGQTTARQTDGPAAPIVDLGNLIAAAR